MGYWTIYPSYSDIRQKTKDLLPWYIGPHSHVVQLRKYEFHVENVLSAENLRNIFETFNINVSKSNFTDLNLSAKTFLFID